MDRKQNNVFMATSPHWCGKMFGVSAGGPVHLTTNNWIVKKALSVTGLVWIKRTHFLGLECLPMKLLRRISST